MAVPTPRSLGPRRFGATNWRGFHALYRRGMMRTFKYAWEFLGGPMVFSLMFLAVFVLAAGGSGEMAPGVSLMQFIAPGIVIFSLSHAAFENAAFALLDDKLEGMIGDLLAAPLSPAEILGGYVLAALCSALLVGALNLGVMFLFVDLRPHDLLAVAGFAAAAALLFALIGVLAALWAERWEHYAMAETFMIMPLGFLSGTFFTRGVMPENVQPLITLNPVFHAVDGFRYGLTGFAEADLAAGAALLAALDLGLWLLAWRLFATGYKVKP
jgi:ABC-2 type transport system permease protein